MQIYLYDGYEVWVTEARIIIAQVTRYRNAHTATAYSSSTTTVRLSSRIRSFPEMLDGKIVVAAPAADKSGVDASFIISNYNIVLCRNGVRV